MAGAAALATLASTGVSIFGAISGAKQEAFKAKFDASVARTNANEADMVYRQDLTRQLANIKAIRASAGMGGTAPTFVNYLDENRQIGEQARHRKTFGFQQQGLMSEGDADMIQRLGFIKALGYGIGGLSSLAS